MGGKNRSAKARQTANRPLWKHPVIIGAATALLGIIVTAIVTPLGGRLVDAVWPEATPPPAQGRLVATSNWPPAYAPDCDDSTYIAGLPGVSSPESLPISPTEDVRVTAMRDLGAVIWYHGRLALTLAGSDETPLLIMRIAPQVYARQRVTPAWGMEVTYECGGPSSARVLQTILDQGRIEDLGVSQGGPVNPRVHPEPFGRTFTVSSSDAADILIDVFACEGLYDFGMKISYETGGKNFTATVGSPEHPLKIIGGWQGVRRYHSILHTPVTRGPMPLQPGQPGSADGPPPYAATICS